MQMIQKQIKVYTIIKGKIYLKSCAKFLEMYTLYSFCFLMILKKKKKM